MSMRPRPWPEIPEMTARVRHGRLRRRLRPAARNLPGGPYRQQVAAGAQPRRTGHQDRFRSRDCGPCPLRSQCTTATIGLRRSPSAPATSTRRWNTPGTNNTPTPGKSATRSGQESKERSPKQSARVCADPAISAWPRPTSVSYSPPPRSTSSAFNDGLRARQEAREQGLPYISDGDLSKRVITQAKATPDREWLGEVSAVVLQQALADLNTAYRNFFASISGKRKGRKVAAPRFRSRKDSRQAIRFTKNARFAVTPGGKLRLPKIGDVPVRRSRSLPSDPSSVTVVKDPAGRYFASFVVETSHQPLPETDSEIGIDLGLTHFAIASDGRKAANPRLLRRAARGNGPVATPAPRPVPTQQTGTCPGAARRSSNPPEAHAAGGNLRPLGLRWEIRKPLMTDSRGCHDRSVRRSRRSPDVAGAAGRSGCTGADRSDGAGFVSQGDTGDPYP